MHPQDDIEITMLGSGTSNGVPAIGCRCPTCVSTDPRDHRLRPSVLVTMRESTFVIDTSADFRQQMLMHGVSSIDAIIFTHAHFDHIGGFDDVRQFNFISERIIDVYGSKETLAEIRRTFRYAFEPPLQEGGGVPQVSMYEIAEGKFSANGCTIEAISVHHGILPIFAYRFGNCAYITDTSYIPDEAMNRLEHLDVLILDALRHEKHPTHFSLGEAIDAARRIDARRTFFTHISHSILHERDSALLPDRMHFAYDGLVIQSGASV